MLRISSALSVSSSRGKGKGRPEMFVRIRFMGCRESFRCWTAGEPDGDADMRSSSPSIPSSSAFRLRLDIVEDNEKTAERVVLVVAYMPGRW